MSGGLSAFFWIAVFALIFYVGFKVVPIYYKGIIGIRGVCKQNADDYHKYGRGYIRRGINETLENIGIPKSKRNFKINVDNDRKIVVVQIIYKDSANFFDKYTKEFYFSYECEGVTKAVYN